MRSISAFWLTSEMCQPRQRAAQWTQAARLPAACHSCRPSTSRSNVHAVLEDKIGCFFSHRISQRLARSELHRQLLSRTNKEHATSRPTHVRRQPVLVRRPQLVQRQRGSPLRRERIAADAADDAGGQRQQASALDDLLGRARARPPARSGPGPRRTRRRARAACPRRGRAARRCRRRAPSRRSATSRPPSLTSCTAPHLALADQRAHEVAGLDLVGEVDRRRRALDLARDDQLIERLAEVARLAADRPPAGRPPP